MKNLNDLDGLESFGVNHGVIIEAKQSPIIYDDIKSYLATLAAFHKNMSGNDIRYLRLASTIGKEVEKIKWDSKIVRRFIKDTLNSSEEGPLKDFFKEFGSIYSEVTLKIVDTFNDSKYLNIIKRSMDREEICLIDASYNNIFPSTKDDYINCNVYVNNLKSCCYNLVEIDYGNFLIDAIGKLEDSKINMDEILNYIINIENLNVYSKEFILSYINYPNKITKYILRYMNNKREWSQEELISKVMKIRKKDKTLFQAVEDVG